jgi:hypothetical protein
MSAAAHMQLVVSDHAMWRAAERFPRFDTVKIEGEVRAAMRAGRISVECPPGIRPSLSTPITMFVWTPTGLRVYALRAADEYLVVVTTLRKNGKGPG